MLQIIKARDSVQAFSSAQHVSQAPPELISLDTRCSQGWQGEFRGPSPCQEYAKSPAPESTENSLKPGSHFLSKWGDINTIHHRQGFWAERRCGCLPRESPGVNSPAWPPSPASLSGDQSCKWFSLVGMRVGSTLETRCHLSLEHQGTKTPSPTSLHAQELQSGGIWTHENPSCFFQIPVRA